MHNLTNLFGHIIYYVLWFLNFIFSRVLNLFDFVSIVLISQYSGYSFKNWEFYALIGISSIISVVLTEIVTLK
jgi:hypothetical protein